MRVRQLRRARPAPVQAVESAPAVVPPVIEAPPAPPAPTVARPDKFKAPTALVEGCIVMKGPDWEWGIQDINNVGSTFNGKRYHLGKVYQVIPRVVDGNTSYVVRVKWENGDTNSYRYGLVDSRFRGEGTIKYDLRPVVMPNNDSLYECVLPNEEGYEDCSPFVLTVVRLKRPMLYHQYSTDEPTEIKPSEIITFENEEDFDVEDFMDSVDNNPVIANIFGKILREKELKEEFGDEGWRDLTFADILKKYVSHKSKDFCVMFCLAKAWSHTDEIERLNFQIRHYHPRPYMEVREVNCNV